MRRPKKTNGSFYEMPAELKQERDRIDNAIRALEGGRNSGRKTGSAKNKPRAAALRNNPKAKAAHMKCQFILLFLLVTAMPATSASKCRGNPKIVGACYRFMGGFA